MCVLQKYFIPEQVLYSRLMPPFVILRGRWPQADYFWSQTACLVRVTSRHIAWRWYAEYVYLKISKV